ncbi:RNA polymerase sigma factor [Pseudohoeflea coraliihabitans]|uniref:RNA polymerase sigma factor n=1 Tax=Pseudohoeflea coraliihabitans TaxID=2860393 RepID=A0ABS6WNR7_9HYPH|nr:RNA polymerase sigma factor [Pseudohoeflea sp. DP4N28-3]MBW3097609.1 RNA polymerase sigma factor [Pseudohoeflea sp. DP4N28-3]
MNVPTARCAPTDPTATSDRASLVRRARGRDEQAIRELIRQMNPRLFRVARGMAGSDAEAEEIVQETYLLAFTRLDGFRGEAQFATWITRIAINCALMQRRRAQPSKEYDTVKEEEADGVLPFPVQHTELPEAALGRAQIRALLEDAVSQLPPDLRLPFVMREAEGLSVGIIARQLDLSSVTVRTRLFRARRKLRAVLEQRVAGGFESIYPFDGARCSNMADRVIAGLALNHVGR